MSNPLLESSSLPLFDRIQPADVAPAIDTLLARASEALETVVAPDFPAQWEAISAVLDVATEKLGTAWSAINHLNSVGDTAARFVHHLLLQFLDIGHAAMAQPQLCMHGSEQGEQDERYDAIDHGSGRG